MCGCMSDLAAEPHAACVSDGRRSRSVLTVHRLRRERHHEEGLAGGVYPCGGHAVPRHHQPLCRAPQAVRRAQKEVGRPRCRSVGGTAPVVANQCISTIGL